MAMSFQIASEILVFDVSNGRVHDRRGKRSSDEQADPGQPAPLEETLAVQNVEKAQRQAWHGEIADPERNGQKARDQRRTPQVVENRREEKRKAERNRPRDEDAEAVSHHVTDAVALSDGRRQQRNHQRRNQRQRQELQKPGGGPNAQYAA